MNAQSKIRLDNLLVDKGHYPSRSRARDAVSRGCVVVNGVVGTKPGMMVSPVSRIEISDPAMDYVSRSALKLIAALDASNLNPEGKLCVDIGASTGGFTQVLLERGAAEVVAIDVGHGQLDAGLATNPRVTSLEGLNIREVSKDALGGKIPRFLVCDVSFISLRLALPAILELAAPGAEGIFLIKPQFEVGKEHIGKGGMVRDRAYGEACAKSVAEWFDGFAGWKCTHFLPSPITGSDGNHEFLMVGAKDND